MNTDNDTTIAELRQAVDNFIARRQWGPFQTPKNLAMSIAIEAAELMEHFQWGADQELSADDAAAVAAELADILIYCLSFANSCEIDLSQAIELKLRLNEARFPPTE